MNTTFEYRCPNCDGTLSFESDSGQLNCPFCDTELSVEGVEEYNRAIREVETQDYRWERYEAESGLGTWTAQESAKLKVHICKSCKGEIIAESTTAVTSCPYCDNNLFIPQQFADDLRPDYVIPFQLNKEQAKECLREFYKGKLLLNPCFKQENHLDEIKGLYVPFWLFDCDTKSEVQYKATKVRSYSDARYNYVETKHYSIQRSGQVNFHKIPADGSSKLDDTLMESLEPYDYRKLTQFTPAYFAGYMADCYDVEAEQLRSRINQRIRNSVEECFRPRGYATVSTVNVNIKTEKNQIGYALLPVWVLNTRYHGELHTFYINGQTGKIVGKLPTDRSRGLGLFFGSFFLLGALSSALVWLLL